MFKMSSQYLNTRQLLETSLNNAGVSEMADDVFIEWPEIELLATHYLNYVSPWLIVGDKNVAETTFSAAFMRYEREQALKRSSVLPHRTILSAMAHSVHFLASVRVSVCDKDQLWQIWTYDVPLLTWMAHHHRTSMQVRRRSPSLAHGPLLIKMLGFIGSTRDMQLAEININTPCEIFQK